VANELTKEHMEAHIRGYFEACNSGVPEQIAKFFEPAAVHYFPPGMYNGPFRGADKIAERWQHFVKTIGSYWTVDRVLCDAASRQAVIEWTHFKRKDGKVLRGDEWYIFSERGLIAEIRAYYASPQDPGLERLELGGFDYASLGYPMKIPD